MNSQTGAVRVESAILRDALHACRRHIGYVLLFSAALNLLYLAPSIYMLQVYDRVLTSGGLMTLVYLVIAIRKGPIARANPWGSRGIEWRVPSPPPMHNFEGKPPTKRGPYDYHMDALEPAGIPAALRSGDDDEEDDVEAGDVPPAAR